MNVGRTVFAQLLDHLPSYEFQKCVTRYRGDYQQKAFSCWDQYLAMAFAQLTYRDSLRDIEACLRSMQGKLYHMGFRGKVARSTLADANESRDWRIYADFAQVLIGAARPLYAHDPIGVDLEQSLYALDSITIDLCLTLFPWARFRQHKAAVKMHTLLDLHGNIPTFIRITDGKVVHFAVGDADKRGDIAVQVQQGMHLHRGFVLAKPSPGKQSQAEIDGDRVQRVQTLLQIHPDGIVGIQRSRSADQHLGKVRIDSPVARFVGIGQGRARHLAAKSHVVELALHRTQAGFDIAQTVAVSQLRERHGQILIPARESLLLIVAAITSHTFLKLIGGQVIKELSENGSANVHSPLCTDPAPAAPTDRFQPLRLQIEKNQNHS